MARSGLQTDLQLYLKQINEVPLLTAEEEKELGWRVINDNDHEAKERMIKANLRLVVSISKSYVHRGLPLSDMTSVQQRLVHRLMAAGLSRAGYNTVAVIIGLDNVLDRLENYTVDFGRPRGRDPQLYYITIFGEPGGEVWGWRFGGHHVSLHYTIFKGEVVYERD